MTRCWPANARVCGSSCCTVDRMVPTAASSTSPARDALIPHLPASAMRSSRRIRACAGRTTVASAYSMDSRGSWSGTWKGLPRRSSCVVNCGFGIAISTCPLAASTRSRVSSVGLRCPCSLADRVGREVPVRRATSRFRIHRVEEVPRQQRLPDHRHLVSHDATCSRSPAHAR